MQPSQHSPTPQNDRAEAWIMFPKPFLPAAALKRRWSSMIMTLVVMLSLVKWTNDAEAANGRTLICEFEGRYSSFVIMADLISDNELRNEATFESEGIEQRYSLAQRPAVKNELFHFVVNERRPKPAVKVRVFKTPHDEKVATATLLGVKPTPADIGGYCVVV